MAENTKIEWCDFTFNGWEGCTPVSPGCDNCYAEARNNRFHKGENWGEGAPRRRTTPANWKKPLKWNDTPFYECINCGWRGDNPLLKGAQSNVHKSCPVCESLRLNNARPRVFCLSIGDVFDKEVDPIWRADLFQLIHNTPNLDWLLLTKRIGNVRSYISESIRIVNVHQKGEELYQWLRDWDTGLPPENVWMGATFVTQDEFDRDIKKLTAIPARFHFASFEPLLGPVDTRFTDYSDGMIVEKMHDIDWAIAGGETGPRPMNPDWCRSLRDQCKQFGVPFFMKQMGGRVKQSMPVIPPDLFIREFPT